MPTSEPPNGDTPTAKARAFGRSLADFGELNDAEKELVAAAREGRVARIGDEVPKEDDKDRVAKTIRAGLVRFLALGGDEVTPVHEQGVMIRGAVVDGELDFESCTLVGDLILWGCELTNTLTLRGARARTTNLSGSCCREIEADGLEAEGSMYLRNGFLAQGMVRLLGAHIKGTLDCGGGRFEGRGQNGDVLRCDRAQVDGGVYMHDGFAARGAVQLCGANIQGDLACDGGRFQGWEQDGYALNCDGVRVGGSVYLRNGFIARGTVRFLIAHIQGNLECDSGYFDVQYGSRIALYCDGVKIGGNLFLRNGFAAVGSVRLLAVEIGGEVSCLGGIFGAAPRSLVLARATVKGTLWLGHSTAAATFHGGVDLEAATINRIVDMVTERTKRRTPESTSVGAGASPCFLCLDGLAYTRFGESTDLNASARIAFLKLQREDDLGREFKPQPWTQMVKTLREMGHIDAAREVAIEYEEMRRKAGTIAGLTARFLHRLYGFAVGYGHRPMRLARIMIAWWLICSAIFNTAAGVGVMAPSSPVVFENPVYAACRPENGGNWTECKSPYEYTVFNPWIYSLDLILPLVDLQQERDWAPMVTRPCEALSFLGICRSPSSEETGDGLRPSEASLWPFGFVVWVVMWLEILFGWLVSLMLGWYGAAIFTRTDLI